MYQHKNYSIELLFLEDGHAAKCSSSEGELLLRGYKSKGDALYEAMQAIDAHHIAAQIDLLLGKEMDDREVDDVTTLVQSLVKMVTHG